MELAPVAARLAQFLGAVVLFGTPLFFLYGLPGRAGFDLARRSWPRGGLVLAALLVLVGGAVSLSVQSAAMSGEAADAWRPAALWTVATETGFGHGLAARLVLAPLALLASALTPSRVGWGLSAALGAGALASFAWTGHGASDDGTAGLAHLAADVIHLLAAGVWLGALAALVALLAGRADTEALAVLQAGLKRFSGVGTGVVALLILTGLVNSWFLVGPAHVMDLFHTTYGLMLIAKLVLFAAMLGLAALNRFSLTPRLAASASPLAALRWSIGLESFAAIAVLVLVAALGTLPPVSMG